MKYGSIYSHFKKEKQVCYEHAFKIANDTHRENLCFTQFSTRIY